MQPEHQPTDSRQAPGFASDSLHAPDHDHDRRPLPATDPATQHVLKSKGGFARITPAFRYACQGLRSAWRNEAAFRQEIVVILVALPIVPWLAPSLLHGVLMAACLLLVLGMELINSAIEALADAVSVEHNPLLGRAKDMGSAAVLMSVCIAAVVWLSALFLTVSGWWN